MDALRVLKNDHHQIGELFDAYQGQVAKCDVKLESLLGKLKCAFTWRVAPKCFTILPPKTTDISAACPDQGALITNSA